MLRSSFIKAKIQPIIAVKLSERFASTTVVNKSIPTYADVVIIGIYTLSKGV